MTFLYNELFTTEQSVSFSSANNASPLDQFTIRDLISLDILGSINISLTNIGLYLVISALIILVLHLVSNNYNKVISNN